MEDSYISQNDTSRDRYCIEICKAKCCYTKTKIRCKHLGNDNACKIHSQWVDNWCNHQDDIVTTMPILKAIKLGLLPKETLEGCCYANPNLLSLLGE